MSFQTSYRGICLSLSRAGKRHARHAGGNDVRPRSDQRNGFGQGCSVGGQTSLGHIRSSHLLPTFRRKADSPYRSRRDLTDGLRERLYRNPCLSKPAASCATRPDIVERDAAAALQRTVGRLRQQKFCLNRFHASRSPAPLAHHLHDRAVSPIETLLVKEQAHNSSCWDAQGPALPFCRVRQTSPDVVGRQLGEFL